MTTHIPEGGEAVNEANSLHHSSHRALPYPTDTFNAGFGQAKARPN